jgi:hypothetical protein
MCAAIDDAPAMPEAVAGSFGYLAQHTDRKPQVFLVSIVQII